MAYIGTKPTIGNFQICDAISVVNGQAAYTMQVGSANVSPQSANHMIVSLNGTIQKPGSSFTVSGSTITFASNLVTNDVIDFIQILGDVLDLGVPSDATVTAAKLNNDIISGSTELASEPADTDEFLVSDAGTIKRIDYSLIKGGVDGWSSNSGNLLPADASKGIYLGVNSATASNLLDDYEEGTFTPTFIDQNNNQAQSYTNNSSASYTKIGNICYVMMDIEFNSIDSSNLGIYAGIGGYPFTCINAQSSMTGQLALYQTEFGTEEFCTTIEHNKVNGIFYHNGSTVSPGTIGTQLRAFFNFAYKTA